MSRTVILALLASGCGGIEEEADYAAALAQAECSHIERCALGFFEAEHSSQEDCVREVTDDLNDLQELLDDADCSYQSDEAGRCVRRVSGLSCEDWFEEGRVEACDLVYLCEGTGGYTTPPSTTMVVSE